MRLEMWLLLELLLLGALLLFATVHTLNYLTSVLYL